MRVVHGFGFGSPCVPSAAIARYGRPSEVLQAIHAVSRRQGFRGVANDDLMHSAQEALS